MSRDIPRHSDVLDARSRISGKVRRTPVLRADALDQLCDAQVFIKAECLQETGSFKLRGATNRLLMIAPEDRSAGVVAFSSGNHAQGIARAARRLGMPALIVMPSDAPQIKIEGVLADGAEIRLYDRRTESREAISAAIASERGAVLVPSFEDAGVIAGQGTCGLEFAEQVAAEGPPLDHLICCTGGGGLIGGIALALEGVSPQTRVWTAEPEGHDDWRRSLEAGRIVSNPPGTRSICDAILTSEPGAMTWAVGQPRLAGGLVVSDDQVFDAMRIAFRHLKVVAEPGGAAALAAALHALPEAARGMRVGVVLTGGNVDADLFARVLDGAAGGKPARI